MGKIKAVPQISNLNTLEEVTRYLQMFLTDISAIINGNIEIGSNLSVSLVTANFTMTNTEFAIGHTLGRVPVGYIVTKMDAATVVYSGTTTWTDKTIFLKANTTANCSILVF